MLNASRSDKRKRVDLTIEGFASFAADKPANVRLCLHHAIMGEPEKDQIGSLVGSSDSKERVHFNPLAGGIVDDPELNLLYNACDVGITTSMGEGWGLVSFEHGAAGAAQIVPDHSACAEIWSGRAEMIPPARRYTPEFSVWKWARCPSKASPRRSTTCTTIPGAASSWRKRRSKRRRTPNTHGTP